VFNRQLTRIASRIDIRVAVSKDAVDLARRYIAGDYEILFNGIELGAYAGPAPARENAVFFVGRHEPRKGLGVLLGALTHLPADVSLWVASDGPETAELRKRFGSDKRVEWLGRISEAEKIDRMKRARAFCAPSLRGESFGVVLLEAMAAGTSGASGATEPFTAVGRLLPRGVTNDSGGGPSHGPSTLTSCPFARIARASPSTCCWTPPGMVRL
jgi:phosphatidylinositol alpha-mannosyltransferase